MPSTPPPCDEGKEGGQESKKTSCSDPQSPHSSSSSSSSESKEQRNTTMLMLMGAGTRLMSSRSSISGEGQTAEALALSEDEDRIFPTTESTENYVQNRTHSRHAPVHVDTSASEPKKNDITSVSVRTHCSPQPAHDHITEEMRERSHIGHEASSSPSPESETPVTSASTSVKQHQVLTSENLDKSIRGALASVATAKLKDPPPGDTSSNEEKMSVDNLIQSKKPRRKRKPQVKPGQTSGRWTVAEHRAFLIGLRECGREWKKVALRIPTRTSAQIRSHAQKYFSKLQRDHDTMVQQGDTSHAAAAVASDTQQMQPPSQRSVERILADPHAAQREVENTLEALRERYRQLQIRLEQRQRDRTNNARGQVVEDDTTASSSPRKRSLEEAGVGDHRSASSIDDQSSVSSVLSASAASLASSTVAGRDLGNEELIALHVLGGDLPRGDASTEGLYAASASRRSFDESDESSESSDQDMEDDASPTKWHRKEG